MKDEDFSKGIYNELMNVNLNYYSSLILSQDNEASSVFNSLTNDQKRDLIIFLRGVIIDTASNILGVIDGTTFINEINGDYSLKYDNECIHGNLQDYFLEAAELDSKKY